MIVVDLGCGTHGPGITSMERLAEMYQPERIYGFDPWGDESITEVAGIPCQVERKAAWIYDGEIDFHDDNTGSHVVGNRKVPCFGFAQWLLDRGQRAVVKMDIEGSEWVLIGQLKLTGADALIDELVVEWHDPRCKISSWEW